MFGWDVSVLQFMLARRGALVPVDGYFDARHRSARCARYQRAAPARGGRHRGAAHAERPRARPAGGVARPPGKPPRADDSRAPTDVRALLAHWARVYGVDPGLVRALAWMESGYQTGLVSSSGARRRDAGAAGDEALRGDGAPRTARALDASRAGIQVGVVFLRQLLREFHGSESLALAAWYQGPASVRRART